MDKQEHRKRKMAQIRQYLKAKARRVVGNIGALVVVFTIFAASYLVCSITIGNFAQWLGVGDRISDMAISTIASFALGIWLIAKMADIPRLIAWWQKPEPDEEPRPTIEAPAVMTATFTGEVVTGEDHTWLEVPLPTMDGGDRFFYVRLYTDSDICAMVLRKSEGKEIKVGGKVYMPDDDERDEYDLVMVVTDVSTVSREAPKEEVEA